MVVSQTLLTTRNRCPKSLVPNGSQSRQQADSIDQVLHDNKSPLLEILMDLMGQSTHDRMV